MRWCMMKRCECRKTSSRRRRQCAEIEECFVKYVSEFSGECETVRCIDVSMLTPKMELELKLAWKTTI